MSLVPAVLTPSTTTAADPAWYHQTWEHWPWYEVTLAVVILIATAVFATSSCSHMAATWLRRTEFQVAVRFPLLGTLSGVAQTLGFSQLIVRVTLFPVEVQRALKGQWHDIVLLPLVVTCSILVYSIRGLRLIVMYNPDMRKRWGWVLNEPAMVKCVLLAYFAIEVIAWSASLAYGVEKIASLAYAAIIANALLSLVVCSTLATKLRNTNDMFHISMEMQRVGFMMLVLLVFAPPTVSIPAPYQRYYFMVLAVLGTALPVIFSNVLPIRAILRERHGYGRQGVLSLLPWKPSGKVAVEAGARELSLMRACSKTSSMLDSDLGRILNFPPLLETFEGVCQKALCSESLQFLVEVEGFRNRLSAHTSTSDNTEFDVFLGICNKFIKDNAPFEVNIDSKTKMDVLVMAKAEVFKELPLDEKAHVLDAAEREVGKMLQENLLHKFRSTEQFRQINNMLLSLETPDTSTVDLEQA